MAETTGAGTIAVLDLGKTNVKLNVADAAGRVLETLSTPNPTRPGPPWRSHDLDALGAWVFDGLAALARRHPLAHAIAVGHGSGGVLVGDDPDGPDGGAALPMIDYEDASPAEVDAGYAARAGGFLDRGSRIMHASTHAARQLWRMQVERPEAVAAARWWLNLPQYWAWRLSGVAASEVTAMGAQSHLWNVPERRWAPIVAAAGWARLTPPFAPAWATLGPIRAALARRHGLPDGIAVHVGGHDSSVNFHRYQAAGLRDFTLVSTGTWIVAMTDGGDPAGLDERRNMTINADVAGRPICGALAMGGREFSGVAGPDWARARADVSAVAALVAGGTFALPAFGADDGQFPGAAGRGRICGPAPADADASRSLAVLYAALLTLECAGALGGRGAIVLDGSFLAEPLFAPLVAALHPGRGVFASREPTGVATGAALLVGYGDGPAPAAAALERVAPPPGLDLTPYAARWRAAARANAQLEGTPT